MITTNKTLEESDTTLSSQQLLELEELKTRVSTLQQQNDVLHQQQQVCMEIQLLFLFLSLLFEYFYNSGELWVILEFILLYFTTQNVLDKKLTRISKMVQDKKLNLISFRFSTWL